MPGAGTPLADQHALITGAGQGIGAAIARRLAEQGASMTLLGRRREPLQATAAALPPGSRVHIECADVTDEDSVRAAFAAARQALGPLSVLVNNAGQAQSAPFARMDMAHWHSMLAVNLTGSFLCIQAAAADLMHAGQSGRGRVINIASTAGQRGYAYVAAYVAAKHGVVGLTRALALEWAQKGVTVNAVCPGYTETDIVRESIERIVAKTGRSAEAARAELVRSNPQGRLVQPDEVADAVAWLCGPGASAITGQCISVSGGEHM